jgi:hypothetical protein
VLAGCGSDTKYVFMQLTQEMQDLVHNGAGPVPPRDRGRYFDLVSASLRKGPLTNAAVLEAIRSAQREVLRHPVEA